MSTQPPGQQPATAWGFIGLGEMGEPMVATLLSHGLEVIAFDHDPVRVRLSASRGARAADAVADVLHLRPSASSR